MNIDQNNIKGIECKHVAYREATDGSKHDIHLIKEVVHTNDGKRIPRIVLRENVRRPFYITKKPYRNHEEKKEFEHKSKLDKFMSTEARMAMQIQKALGRRTPNPKLTLRDACSDPSVYLAEINSTTIIKHTYKKKWPDVFSDDKVGVLDIETNVHDKNGFPILISVTSGKDKLVAICPQYAKSIHFDKNEVERIISERYKHHLSTVKIKDKETGEMVERNLYEERGMKITFYHDKTIAHAFRNMMVDVHDLLLDQLAIWNMNFDIPKILTMLKHYGIKAEDCFCDPSVPNKYRRIWYKEAKATRETLSKSITQHPADLWHVLYCTAGFYVIDAMCAFKKIRVGKGNEPSYSLDAILNKHLGMSKLHVDGLKANEGTLEWHQEMQRRFPADYVVYNIYDCLLVELLDERTGDLARTVSTMSGVSNLGIYPSLPRRLVNNLAFYLLEKDYVMGCAGRDMTHERDDKVIGIDGWIKTLL